MNITLAETAKRIKSMRELCDFSVAEMAKACGISEAEYLAFESGEADFSFTFLHNCAEKFKIDLVELLSGETPKLSNYSITRKADGLPLKRREGFTYLHLSYLFKDKIAEPFYVTAPYLEEEQNREIPTSTHEGQELDFILKGSLLCRFGDNLETLYAGDCVYYDSGKPHGMIATGGEPCEFLAVVMKK